MQVYITDILEFRNFPQVIIIREQLRPKVSSQTDQLGVYLFFLGKVTIVTFHLLAMISLNAIHTLQSATASCPLYRITGISNLLKFFQHKSRHNNDPFQKISFNEVRNPPINHDARIQ